MANSQLPECLGKLNATLTGRTTSSFSSSVSGGAPLNDVDFKADIIKDSPDPVDINFYCDDRSSTPTLSLASYQEPIWQEDDICDYPTMGNYTAKIEITQGQAFTSDTIPVNVGAPAPEVILIATPSEVRKEQSSELTWVSTNADSCNASGDWSGDKPITSLAPESTGILLRSKTYTLTCSGPGGERSDTATVTVTDSPISLWVELTARDIGSFTHTIKAKDPLLDLDLRATAHNFNSDPMNFKFYCNIADTTPIEIVESSDPVITLNDICDYPSIGRYAAKVVLTQGAKSAEDAVEILVGAECALSARDRELYYTKREIGEGFGFGWLIETMNGILSLLN
jgi:hypothetical protein